MEIRACITIYGEKKRYVFAKELKKIQNKKEVTKEAYVELTHINEAKKYLDLNWIGIELRQENEGYLIKFIQYKS